MTFFIPHSTRKEGGRLSSIINELRIYKKQQLVQKVEPTADDLSVKPGTQCNIVQYSLASKSCTYAYSSSSKV